MRSKEFIIESTALEMDGRTIAVRSSAGKGSTKVTMQVTRDEWNAIKKQQANTERMEYDLASAETIVKDWVSGGSKVVWKTAADWNTEARAMASHRFRDDPEVSDRFDAGIASAQDKARATTKASMRTVEAENFPSVRTMEPMEIALKHNVSIHDIEKQLEKGTQAEMEHTTDVNAAREIALDHLAEMPDYYDKLEKMERAGRS